MQRGPCPFPDRLAGFLRCPGNLRAVSDAVSLWGYQDLDPYPVLRCTVLPDGYSREGEYFMSKEESAAIRLAPL